MEEKKAETPEAAAAWAEEYLCQGKPEQAALQYRRALKGLEELWQASGNRSYARAAGELCTLLADLSMEQGNMHGADYYYALALRYRDPEKF